MYNTVQSGRLAMTWSSVRHTAIAANPRSWFTTMRATESRVSRAVKQGSPETQTDLGMMDAGLESRSPDGTEGTEGTEEDRRTGRVTGGRGINNGTGDAKRPRLGHILTLFQDLTVSCIQEPSAALAVSRVALQA